MTTLRRWLPTIALFVLLSAGCAAAGVWQWNRYLHRSAAVAVVEANYAAEVVPFEAVVRQPGAPLAEDDVWRPVRASGSYLGASVLLRNRPVGGQPGFHVLVPFVVQDGALAGTVLVVDRGWVPTGDDGSDAAAVPAPPPGVVDLVVRLRQDERPSDRQGPPGQVHSITADDVREAAMLAAWDARATLPLYGGLVSENGARPADVGGLARPSTDLGSHLSYAFQWWVFAIGALVGCWVLIRRESRQDAADEAPLPRGRPGRLTAEQEEDALLDAQL